MKDDICFYKGEDLMKVLKDIQDNKVNLDSVIIELKHQQEYIHYCKSSYHILPYKMINCETFVGTPGLYIGPTYKNFTL